MVTFHCQRIGCRYCDDSDNCNCPDNEITININKECSGYKKGVWHYICAVKMAMGNNNTMLPAFDLNTEIKIGVYFIVMLYNITYAYTEYGNWGWISFYDKDEKESKALSIENIFKNYKLNIDQFNLFTHYLENSNNDNEVIEKITGKVQPEEVNDDYIFDYGFINPMGDFSQEDWGEHENLAYRIIQEKNWEDEWVKEGGTCVDFLVFNKHYVLIHAPNIVDINVTYNGKMTKKQREFLYDYFMNRNMPLRANLYYNEDY
ncbi:MAG: hypothetical protein IJS58_09600 [Bacilli bacterium]|nr:hypothetical protein [Bacilli bacterium]